MAAQRRVVPIVALVAVIALLVGLRLTLGGTDDDGDTADGAERAEQDDASGAPAPGSTQFVDVTEFAGLDEPHSDTDLTGESAMTAGAAVADIDGDGDLDLFLGRIARPDRLMRNEGDGTFTEITEQAGLPVDGRSPNEGTATALFADLSTDGLPDLVLTGAGADGLTLHLNQGDGTFADGTTAAGLDLLPAPPEGRLSHLHGLTVADYDRDGDLDLLVTHWDETIPAALADPAANSIQPDQNDSLVCARAKWLAERDFPRAPDAPANRGRLLRNEGGTFSDVTAQLGLPFDQVLGFTGTFADVDGDGWQDLAITGDFCTSRLFRNVEGTRFQDVTATSGIGTDENGMGSVITDLDGDGNPDWFVTSIGPVGDDPAPLQLGGGFGSSGNRAYLNRGDGTFRDATDELGLRNGGWGWGAAVEDFTNEGRRSVVMTNGYSIGEDDDAPSASDPLVFWQRDGADGPFRDVAADLGLDDTGLGRALVPFDMDRDGDLDLLVANFGAPPVLYRNDTPERRWLTVALDDLLAPANRTGIGAKVVVTPDGGDPVTGWIIGGGSYESQVPTEFHVGLGDAATARVEVHWPDGAEPDVFDDVAADQVLTLQRID